MNLIDQKENIPPQRKTESLILYPKDSNTPKKVLQISNNGEDHDFIDTEPKSFSSKTLHFSQIPMSKALFHSSIEKKKYKKLWTNEEDNLLKHLVQTKGAKQWGHISTHFANRCGKQCRQRWHNHLRNGIKKGDWTHNEEWVLFLGVYAYGKKWSIISKLLKGRTQNSLKNHWNCKMKPKKAKLYDKMKSYLINFQQYLKGLTLIEYQLFEQIRKMNTIQTKLNQEQVIKMYLNNIKLALEQYELTKNKLLGKYGSQQQLKYQYQGSMQQQKQDRYEKIRLQKLQSIQQHSMDIQQQEYLHEFGDIDSYSHEDSYQSDNIELFDQMSDESKIKIYEDIKSSSLIEEQLESPSQKRNRGIDLSNSDRKQNK